MRTSAPPRSLSDPNAFGATAVVPAVKRVVRPPARAASPLRTTRMAKPGSSVDCPSSATLSNLNYWSAASGSTEDPNPAGRTS